MRKASKIVVEQRVAEVLQLVLAGAGMADLCQHASSKKWKVGERQIARYLSQAYRRFRKETEQSTDQNRARHLLQRRALYARCMRIQDYKTALAVLRDEAELLGLYVQRIEHVDGNQSLQVTFVDDFFGPENKAAYEAARAAEAERNGGTEACGNQAAGATIRP